MLTPTLRRKLLKHARAPTLLITNLTNLRYLTGLQLSAGSLILTKRGVDLYVDGRYIEKARRDCTRGITVRRAEESRTALRKIQRCAFEAEDVTVGRLKRLHSRNRRTRFVPREGIVEEFRRRKRDDELRSIRRACRITDRILRRIPRWLRPGVRERGVAWEIEQLARQLGADDIAFETIVAFGRNSSLPHHRAGSTKLRKGDLVQIDMGVKVRGYCSDCSRVFFTRKPTEEQRKVYDLLRSIVRESTRMMRAGALNTLLDTYARRRLKDHGYDKHFLHSLGHGVGLEIHEGVNLSAKAKRTKILPNEVVTTEPGVYLEGKWGLRLEDTVLVTRKKGIALTRARM